MGLFPPAAEPSPAAVGIDHALKHLKIGADLFSEGFRGIREFLAGIPGCVERSAFARSAAEQKIRGDPQFGKGAESLQRRKKTGHCAEQIRGRLRGEKGKKIRDGRRCSGMNRHGHFRISPSAFRHEVLHSGDLVPEPAGGRDEFPDPARTDGQRNCHGVGDLSVYGDREKRGEFSALFRMKKEGKRDGFAAPDLPRGLFGRSDGCRVAGKSQGNVGADGLRGMVVDDRQRFHTVALRQERRNLKTRGDLL